MEIDKQTAETKAFSYDILDEEARKISELVLLVNQKYATCHLSDLPMVIYQMGDQAHSQGRLAEAEFLYLHAVSLWEREYKLEYPFEFRGLRTYAKALSEKHEATRGIYNEQIEQAA